MTAARVRYAEDYHPGELIELGEYVMTEAEIVDFARTYDPHPFHLDPQAARDSIFGGLTASGWLTALVMMRLMHRGFISVETSLGSPGHDELRWLEPVRPGDRLQGRVEVLGVKLSRSRPELGFVQNRATLTNQNGVVVYRLVSSAIIRTRPVAAA